MEWLIGDKKMNTNEINRMEAKKFLDEIYGNGKVGYVKITDKRNYPFEHPDVCQWKITEIENVIGYGFNGETLFITGPLNEVHEVPLKMIEQLTSHVRWNDDKYVLLVVMDSVRHDY